MAGGSFVGWRRAVLILGLAAASPLLLAVDTLTDHFAARILAAHNRERDTQGVPRLIWSEELAGSARAWAEHLSKVGYLAHSEDAPGNEDPEGENLWAGTRDSYTVEQMIGYWLEERKHFRAGRFPNNSDTGEVEDIGHYTQLVWRTTARVGCAIAENGQDEYLVCRYHEGGNIIGESPI